MNRFSRSQAATVILLSIFLLSFYGWRHYAHHRLSSTPPQVYPLGAVVQVSGKVRNPGIYSFDQPVTVRKAVTRAGGLLPDLKLPPQWETVGVAHAGRLQIVAESNTVAGVRIGWMAVPSRLVLGEPLDVNQATCAELALVPGIRESLAKGIVAERKRAGGFSRLEDLLFVKGIGPASLNRLRPYLQVGASQSAVGKSTR
jgi:competence protein ComEA